MPDIDDFIHLVTKQTGVGEAAARQGTGGLLSSLKDMVGGADFQALSKALPGTDRALQAAPSGEGGGVMGAIGELLGGGGDVLGVLGKAGISPDKIAPFVSSFLGFLKDHVPADLVSRLLAKAGPLAKLAG